MLKKYENFFKLSKTKQCSFYEANLRQDMNKVLLKKLKSKWSWNQMLKSHALKLQSTQNFAPKVLQIFKHNGNYFIAYQKPNGSSLSCFQQNLKLQLDEFYSVYGQLVDSVSKLKQQISNVYIYPQWIYFHRNGIKICHFEPYFQQKKDRNNQQNHVFIYDMMNGKNLQQQVVQNEQKSKRIKNMNFNLGYIAYHLLTGRITQWKQDENIYESKIKQIQLNAQVRIFKETNDKLLTSLVTKLLNCSDQFNSFEEESLQNQLFQEFKSYLKRKRLECRNCKVNRQSFRIVEFSLQKIKLQKKMSKIKTEKKKKCFRPCCCKTFEDQPNPEDQTSQNQKYQVVQKNNSIQKVVAYGKRRTMHIQSQSSQSRNKIKQKVFSNNKTTSRYNINASRILPSLETPRKNVTMFSRARHSQNLQTMFKRSMQAAKTSKIYLKTEY